MHNPLMKTRHQLTNKIVRKKHRWEIFRYKNTLLTFSEVTKRSIYLAHFQLYQLEINTYKAELQKYATILEMKTS